MKINIGDKYKVIGERSSLATGDETIYTVTEVIQNGKATSIAWDCIGRKIWYKRVSLTNIEEWIEEGRLIKIN